MPSIDLPIGPSGPLVQVHVGASVPHMKALNKIGKPSPAMVAGSFLIDTGASHTVMDPGLIAPLGLTPTGSTPIHTPSTGAGSLTCDEYDVLLHIPAAGPFGFGHIIEAMPVIIADLRSQGIDGLIGRDVLAKCILIMNGPAGRATLAF